MTASGVTDGTDDFADFEERNDRPSRRGRRRPKRGAPKGKDAARRGTARAGCRIHGLVCSRSRRNVRVRTEEAEEVVCYLPGGLAEHELPVVGDRVAVNRTGAGEGVLEEVLPRRNALTRVAEDDPGKRKTLASNLDCLFVVLAASPFPPKWALADRLLAVCDRDGIETAIVVNKTDLVTSGSADACSLERAAAVYRDVGFPVLLTSAVAGTGIDDLREAMRGRLTIFAGHSGVGKSSLLNAVHPGWELAVGEVNPKTRKGRQTTTGGRLLALPFGGHVVDTPGFREFGLGDLAPAELGRCYREFRPVIGHCRFTDCLHDQEPECALRRAVERGRVSSLRYQNYLQILHGLVEGLL